MVPSTQAKRSLVIGTVPLDRTTHVEAPVLRIGWRQAAKTVGRQQCSRTFSVTPRARSGESMVNGQAYREI